MGDPLTLQALIMGGSSLLSSLFGLRAGNRSADRQLMANREAIAAEERQRALDREQTERQRQIELAQWRAAMTTAYQNALSSWGVKSPILSRYGLNLARPEMPDLNIPGYTPGSTTGMLPTTGVGPGVRTPSGNTSLLGLARTRRLMDDAEGPAAVDASPWGAGFSGRRRTLADLGGWGG